MKAVLYTAGAGLHNDALIALGLGIKAMGWTPVQADPVGFKDPDPDTGFAAVWGLRGITKDILRAYQDLCVPVIVVDLGHLKREQGYVQVSVNRLAWLPPVKCPGDRLAALGLKPAQRKRGREYILLCGQKPRDAQHNLNRVALSKWAEDTALAITRRSDKPIVWRPHPDGGNVEPPPQAARISDPKETPLADDLAGAHALVTINSTCGNQALLSGVPVFCRPDAIYAAAANPDLAAINRPRLPVRGQYFNRLAYAQWNFEEMATGAPLKFFQTFMRAFQT